MSRKMVTIDGNEAAAYVAYKTNEVAAIYPITPSSNMGEWADLWASQDIKNIYGTRPIVSALQSEGGASGAVHGALQTGALTTTFTASQGLLLMIPNMFKIAGELTSTVFHIAARSVATHALSIFGDHSDVMAARSTGWALLSSSSVQEVMDMALISQAATLESRIPFIHFFDGFRTSHEVQKIEQLTDDDMIEMIDDDLVIAHRQRALTPDKPVLRGTAQNPDVFFQSKETANAYYEKVPGIVQEAMDKFAKITGRQYNLFDYYGADDAENIIIIMGSGADTVRETVDHLIANDEKVGVLQIHLYRPFAADIFFTALPKTVKKLAVLDRTKEPNALGEPMYQDVLTAIAEAKDLPFANPVVIGGRYGLSSKEFTPAMVKGIYDELSKDAPKNHFTIGINDDVSHTSLDYDHGYSTEAEDVFRGMFWGLGSDGTVGANKNSIKIIGEETDNFAQGYFVYDSKKSGSITTSHLRFGPREIKSTYLITSANFVACHQSEFIYTYDMLRYAADNSTFLLNSQYSKDEVWDKLPKKVQEDIISKNIKFYIVDAYTVGKKTGMGTRINTIMQTCFFAISGILPRDEAIAKIKGTIKKTYGNKGEEIVRKNYEAVDASVASLHQVDVPATATSTIESGVKISDNAPDFVKNVIAEIIAGRGDDLPVSAMPLDGTFPTGTTKWEKRNITLDVPAWDPDICIQCGKCALVCPHQVIRMNVADESALADAPTTLKNAKARGKEYGESDRYMLQLAVEDCTGCEICIDACPVMSKTEEGKRAINMVEQLPIREQERENLDFFLELPMYDRSKVKQGTIKGVQYLETLFEFSGACAGCGETP
ncbi:MAG: pyruvate:ferredoxin (flavodoxin) oxidoreductase, partial [Candidatus Marinimicrobia bacterium]|nr:pyruvate:ferredoxin (flavodoxin) oxidoreductase [Candidatus Neomarinimicrobiota bacterium]